MNIEIAADILATLVQIGLFGFIAWGAYLVRSAFPRATQHPQQQRHADGLGGR